MLSLPDRAQFPGEAALLKRDSPRCEPKGTNCFCLKLPGQLLFSRSVGGPPEILAPVIFRMHDVFGLLVVTRSMVPALL